MVWPLYAKAGGVLRSSVVMSVCGQRAGEREH